ncbi:NAD-dependent epimerase/dehydratase family protein [Trinickia mobilis]|uniref:NAD-dependent epimerase/dehydratase family protein n=1 Tax=Trinickia mobilis TaxID=2816356 RepID=UPI001A8EC001|nr:NAD-dependent epimerase/dehydratase family protein [Trinickia mobilis]
MRILVIGATGLLGKEIVGLLSADHDVIGASRKGSAIAVDISDKKSIVAMYRQAAPLDAVVCVAGIARFVPLDTLADGDFAFSIANKLMGQVNLVRCGVANVTRGGSSTLTSALVDSNPRGSRAGNNRRALNYRHFIKGLERNCLDADVSAQA